MYGMSSHERIKRMYEHKEADRVAIFDRPWGRDTIGRWHREGMPLNIDYIEFFGLDRIVQFEADISPKYDVKVIEETNEYVVYTTQWGATKKSWKNTTSTPEHLDYRIKTQDGWMEAKERMKPGRDRIPWDFLKENYGKWREQGAWIQPNMWFGFDVTHSHVVGTERFLVAMMEEPEWCVDMFNHFLDMSIAHLDMIWEAGYTFDAVRWPDDMGYKGTQFFSMSTYRELLKPVQKRAIEWIHSKGIKAYLHSCGNINPFIPELIELGLDGLNPLEVKAGMDPVYLKENYGDKLLLHGGMNAMLWEDREAMEFYVKNILNVMKKSGGYIFGSDHSVPSTVALEDFGYMVEIVKDIGRY